MSINELFGTNNEESSSNSRTLTGTSELTRIASEASTDIIRSMEEQIDVYRDRIAESADDSKALDKLLDEFRPFAEVDEDSILRELSDDTVESMLKSQQSKRSRCKSKTMTLDNYHAMLTAAIAEDLLRELYNKPKQSGGFQRRSSALDYTPAQLEAYTEDQQSLRKEIRNIQSKKSIMKSKADFDESSEAWQQLLKAEIMLKDLRIGGRASTVVEVDHTKDALSELLADMDPEHLKAADAKELLARIKDLTEM